MDSGKPLNWLLNSIDAKANDIRVKISGGGRERIEVEDNGQGIKYEEVNLAFLRHATSKIRQEADLQRILSLVVVGSRKR